MVHITHSETRAEATSTDWLELGRQIGWQANRWAGRSDLIAYVGPGAGGPAPACYNPALAEVEVNVDVAFGMGVDPSEIGDMTTRAAHLDWPKAAGALYHEAMHARYSAWNLREAKDTLTPAVFTALELLEESRIEAFGVKLDPRNATLLRSCALEIVLADIEDSLKDLSAVDAAAQLAALTLARVDAGVLTDADVEVVNDAIVDVLGQELLDALRGIWQRVHLHDMHHAYLPLVPLAQEWVDLLRAEREKRGEMNPADLAELLKKLFGALADSAGDTEIAVRGELDDEQMQAEWTSAVSARDSDARERREHKQTSEKVFSKGTGPGAGGTRSELVQTRIPRPDERTAAVTVARLLEKAKYRERSETDVTSIVPPGRLRSRAIIQGAALRSRGITDTSEPWRRTIRKHTEDPTLTVGVMVDISGSMSAAMEPMATTAWVMSEAVRRVQGRAAMVYYGTSVFPTLRPGEHLPQVNVYSAPDGTEKFDQAFKALDGSLNLLQGTGARLLVIVSDGCYTREEQEAAAKWVRRCKQAGVAVLWMTFEHSTYVDRYAKAGDISVLSGIRQPAKAAVAIGKAAADALTRVSRAA